MIINSQEKLLNFKSFECVEFETFNTTKIYKYVSDSIFSDEISASNIVVCFTQTSIQNTKQN
jgi:hypothetical protein